MTWIVRIAFLLFLIDAPEVISDTTSKASLASIAQQKLSGNETYAQCHRRDSLEPLRHEAFCVIPLCRHRGFWSIGASDLSRLIRDGTEDILERIWNLGEVRILPGRNDLHYPGLVLINNANTGSAHFAMYFGFPAYSFAASIMDRLGMKEQISISTIAHRMSLRNIANAPWTRDFAPFLYSLLNFPDVIYEYDNLIKKDPSACMQALIFHEIDMRNRFSGQEPLPRWIASQAVASQIRARMFQDEAYIHHQEARLAAEVTKCDVLLVERIKTLNGSPAARRIENQPDLVNLLQRKFGPQDSICKVSFENLPFKLQAQYINNAKVVIAAHGAGLVNVAFMRPCSVLLEIFTPLVWNHGMYQSLAGDVGVVYRRAVGVKQVREGLGCDMSKWFSLWDPSEILKKCTIDEDCSGCSRDQAFIRLDLKTFALKLEGALLEMNRCQGTPSASL